MVSLWALHGTGRELLLSSTSPQDFCLENISSAQYFKISVQPSLSHLSYFEEKSPLMISDRKAPLTGAEKHWQPQVGPVDTQPVHELPGSPELLMRHCRASKRAARQHQKTLQVNLSHVCSCQSAPTCSNLCKQTKKRSLSSSDKLCISLAFPLNSTSVVLNLKNVQ